MTRSEAMKFRTRLQELANRIRATAGSTEEQVPPDDGGRGGR